MKEDSFTFHFETPLPFELEDVFAWHEKPGAFNRLLPPFAGVKVLSKNHRLRVGDRVEFKHILFKDAGIQSEHEITYVEKNDSFVDEQIKGVFQAWNHLHKFRKTGSQSCTIEDIIRYKLPFESILGHLVNSKVARKLRRVFNYRKRILENDLAFIQNYPEKKWHILMTGASGLVGTQLKALLQTMGHIVTPIQRHLRPGEEGIRWDIENQILELDPNDHFDAVIHLAGENISGIWTEAKKEAIFDSRIQSTKLLVKSIEKLKTPPKVFICASGVNYYPMGKMCDESTHAGEGFLKEVIEAWELEASALKSCRVVHMRTGVVLSPSGGMLKSLLPLYKAGLGSTIGSGQMKMSWIALDDLIYTYTHALFNESLEGPVNATSPFPISQKDFSKLLAELLKRPHFMRAPQKVFETFLGDMAKETLLADLEVYPKKLVESQYTFAYPNIKSALKHCLGI